jgi:hypothetical protein
MKNSKTILLLTLLLTSGIFFQSYPQSLTGTWELIYVAPVYADDSEPKGITNIRFHFTEDGKLYTLLPGDSLTDDLEIVNYAFVNNVLTVIPPGQDSVLLNLFFNDSNSFSFSLEGAPSRTFRKMNDPSTALKAIEPKSIQLINTGDTSNYNVTYDDKDYSSLPYSQRLTGNWEVMAYENISNGDMPPYGFLNDTWTFNGKKIHIFSRMDQKEIFADYIPANGGDLIVTPEDGSKVIMKTEFNRWGHLVLDTGNEIIKLKLISKDTDTIPTTPLKVVLLKLVGEE